MEWEFIEPIRETYAKWKAMKYRCSNCGNLIEVPVTNSDSQKEFKEKFPNKCGECGESTKY